MTPLIQNPVSNLKQDATPFNFPVERLTENILALSDAAVIITNGETIDYCTESIVSVLGIQRETIMKGGWPCLIDLIHPADIRLLEKKLLPEIRKHFKNLTENDRHTRNFKMILNIGSPLLTPEEIRKYIQSATFFEDVLKLACSLSSLRLIIILNWRWYEGVNRNYHQLFSISHIVWICKSQ